MSRCWNDFLGGLRVFWRDELPILASIIGWVIGRVIMVLALILAVSGCLEGFWLFHAPSHTTWGLVRRVPVHGGDTAWSGLRSGKLEKDWPAVRAQN